MRIPITALGILLTASLLAPAQDSDANQVTEDASRLERQMEEKAPPEGEAENASNPLAKVANTDFRWQYLDVDGDRINDFSIDGAFMAHEKLKVRYELHYWETDVTGKSKNDWESFLIKPIFFPTEGRWREVKYRMAVGMDWIVDLGDRSRGVGSGSDVIGPFAGMALGFKSRTMVIPLVQQFVSYNGADRNETAFRLIGLQPLPGRMWTKLDAKVPIDWENDEAVPANVEIQLGKNFTDHVAFYVDGLVGIGGDKPFDWGVGTGLRFNY